MVQPTSRPRKTVEDYLALPDDVRAELIGGDLYVTPSPVPRHQDAAGRLYQALLAWSDVGDRVRGRPDLVVEVVSPGGALRDRIVKRDLYARSGVPAYWIADPEERSLEILRLEGSTYAAQAYLTSEDVLEVAAMPGLRIPLASVFRPA